MRWFAPQTRFKLWKTRLQENKLYPSVTPYAIYCNVIKSNQTLETSNIGMNYLTITAPDDWHLHLRDGELLAETVPATARCFERAIVMPNLQPPITNSALALAYQKRILAASPRASFTPLMTLYLTDKTTPAMIGDARRADVTAAKLYPAGATTNSTGGVNSIEQLYPAFEAMSESGMLLLVHGEVTDPNIDIFDREQRFIEDCMTPIQQQFPDLKIVFEHITTSDAVDFVLDSGPNMAATITPQHLLLNRNDMLAGGIRPHNYCLPVLKRNTHQQRLREAVKSGSPKFFLGTDSAPHHQHLKESACGCAGCYSAPGAIELYAQVFEEIGALNELESFASHYGADFYGLPRNTGQITLKREEWRMPELIDLPNGETVVPFHAGQLLSWKLQT